MSNVGNIRVDKSQPELWKDFAESKIWAFNGRLRKVKKKLTTYLLDFLSKVCKIQMWR